MDNPRAALDALIVKNGENYTSISRLLGRNAAYIQQYIRRGSPRQLDEHDRALLARYFGVDERLLGSPARQGGPVVELVHVQVMSVEASAGHGALASAEARSSQIGFEEKWLRRLTSSKASSLSIIGVLGDSMEPTLHNGDEVMVDLADNQSRLRDGIYVLRMDDMLSVKRVAIEPQGQKVSVLSDNPAYPSWRGLEKSSINIVGRVLWFGRSVR